MLDLTQKYLQGRCYMSKTIYDLCYEQYKSELAESNSLYQKSGTMIGVIPVLAGSTYFVSRIDLIDQLFMRVDIFFFYLFSLAAIGLLVASTYYLFKCISPKKYISLANLDAWTEWHNKLAEWSHSQSEDKSQQNISEDSLIEGLCKQFADSQPHNAKINESRSKSLGSSVKLSGYALVAIGCQSIFGLLLTLQGV